MRLVPFLFGLLVLSLAVPATAQPATQQKPRPPAAATVTSPLDLNTATVTQLESLPGIGPATAKRIVEYREKNGGFKKIEELMNVRGIGEKSFLKLKDLIAVAPKRSAAGVGSGSAS